MATYIPQDSTGVLISDISKGTQTNDIKITLDGETVTLSANDGVDIGDVTINNTSLPVTQSGTWNIGTLTSITNDVNVNLQDGSGTNLTSTLVGANQSLDVNITQIVTVTETNSGTIASDTTSIDGKITTCDTGNIAGTVTANAGTNLNTSLLALESGGNLATIAGKDFATETTLSTLNGKVTACDTGNITIGTALPAGSNTIGKINIVDASGNQLVMTTEGYLSNVLIGWDYTNSTYRIGQIDSSYNLHTVDKNSDAIKTANETVAGAVSGNEMQVDIIASLPAGTNTIGKTGHDITGIGHGNKTITTAGTDEALATSTTCKKIIIQAYTQNTGLIAIGGTGVDATETTGTGITLEAGDSIEIQIDDLADIYVDATESGEGVRYTYFT